MSTSVDQQQYECEQQDCDEQFAAPEAVRGSFCSAYCFYTFKGAKALNKIIADHRFCATCFKPIKDVAPPPDEWVERATSKLDLALTHGAAFDGEPGDQLVIDATACPDTVQPVAADAVIGHQHETQHTTRAIDKDDNGPGASTYSYRWGCECGIVDPETRDEAIERSEWEAVILDLLRTLSRLAAEGTIARRPSKADLFDALREHGRDWDYAIGRALYGSG